MPLTRVDAFDPQSLFFARVVHIPSMRTVLLSCHAAVESLTHEQRKCSAWRL